MKTRTFQTLLLTFCIIVCNTTLSLAQEKQMKEVDPAKRAEQITGKMKEALALSDEQAEKVKVANLNMITKKQELRSKSQAEKVQKKGQMKSVQKEYVAEMKKILNTEQFEKFRVRHEKMMEKQRQAHQKNKK